MRKKISLAMALILMLSGFLTACSKKETNVITDISMDAYEQYQLGEEKAFLVALSNGERGIKADTKFQLTIQDQPMTEVHVKTNLKTGEKLSCKVKALSRDTYEVIPESTLDNDSIVNFQFTDMENKEYKWAFQVEKEFSVEGSLPGNMSVEVPINSGIEIKLTMESSKDPTEYFSILPKTEGKLEIQGSIIRFIPNQLLPDTAYQVTLRKGFGSGDEVLKEDYHFQFRTGAEESSGNRSFEFVKKLYHLNTQETPYIPIQAYSYDKENISAKVSIYSYNHYENFIETIQAFERTTLYGWEKKFTSFSQIDVETMTPIEEFETEIAPYEENYTYTHVLPFPNRLEAGLYLVDIQADGKHYQTHLQIQSLNAYVTLCENGILTWVNDLIKGKPI